MAFLAKKNNPELTWLEKPVANTEAVVGMKKGSTELLNQVNACIDELKSDGTLDDMRNRWYNMDNPNYTMPDIPLPKEGKPILIGIATDNEPSMFLAGNGDVIGLDGELARRIAKYMNRPLEFVDMKLDAFPTALASGKVDMVISNFIMTEQLKETVDASHPYFDTPFVVIVKKGK